MSVKIKKVIINQLTLSSSELDTLNLFQNLIIFIFIFEKKPGGDQKEIVHEPQSWLLRPCLGILSLYSFLYRKGFEISNSQVKSEPSCLIDLKRVQIQMQCRL